MSLRADILGRLQSAATPDERWQVACDEFAALGGDLITTASAAPETLQPVRLRTSVPKDLMNDYIGAGLPRRDRWLQHCSGTTAIETVDLKMLDRTAANALEPALGEILIDHGVTRVVLIPASTATRVEAMVVYATSRDRAARLARAAVSTELKYLAALIATFRAHDMDWTSDGSHYRFADLLSPREREVLLWLASGLRTAEIAHRMGIEPVTVGLHLQGARRKLGARTREQALAIALRDRHISF